MCIKSHITDFILNIESDKNFSTYSFGPQESQNQRKDRTLLNFSKILQKDVRHKPNIYWLIIVVFKLNIDLFNTLETYHADQSVLYQHSSLHQAHALCVRNASVINSDVLHKLSPRRIDFGVAHELFRSFPNIIFYKWTKVQWKSYTFCSKHDSGNQSYQGGKFISLNSPSQTFARNQRFGLSLSIRVAATAPE